MMDAFSWREDAEEEEKDEENVHAMMREVKGRVSWHTLVGIYWQCD